MSKRATGWQRSDTIMMLLVAGFVVSMLQRDLTRMSVYVVGVIIYGEVSK